MGSSSSTKNTLHSCAPLLKMSEQFYIHPPSNLFWQLEQVTFSFFLDQVLQKANARWCLRCLKSLTLSTVTQISIIQLQSTEVHLSQLMREGLTTVWSRLESGRSPAPGKPRGQSFYQGVSAFIWVSLWFSLFYPPELSISNLSLFFIFHDPDTSSLHTSLHISFLRASHDLLPPLLAGGCLHLHTSQPRLS